MAIIWLCAGFCAGYALALDAAKLSSFYPVLKFVFGAAWVLLWLAVLGRCCIRSYWRHRRP